MLIVFLVADEKSARQIFQRGNLIMIPVDAII